MLQLENQKDSLKEQLIAKEHALEELKAESSKDSSDSSKKIEDLKAKYDKAMDELTQNKIVHERNKALME